MRLDASCSEDSVAGKFLADLYYNHPDTLALFTLDERSGFPSDGTEHSLVLTASRADIVAFLDLVKERHGDTRGCSSFVNHIYDRMD